MRHNHRVTVCRADAGVFFSIRFLSNIVAWIRRLTKQLADQGVKQNSHASPRKSSEIRIETLTRSAGSPRHMLTMYTCVPGQQITVRRGPEV